jgi:hypothetical protein
LQAWLADTNPAHAGIVYTGSILGAGAITVPAGKTLYLGRSDSSGLTTTFSGSDTLEVTGGKAVIYNGYTSTAANGIKVSSGSIEVEGGNITVDTFAHAASYVVGLGSTITFLKNSTLEIDTVLNTTDLTAAAAYIGAEARLYVSTLTAGTLADIITAADSKELYIYTLGTLNADTAPSITVPADLTINTISSGSLAAAVTSLTVDGRLYLSSGDTLANLTSLTVNGYLSAYGATLKPAAGTTVTVGQKATTVRLAASGVFLAADVTIPKAVTFRAGLDSASTGKIILAKGNKEIYADVDITVIEVANGEAILGADLTIGAGEMIIISSGRRLTVPAGRTITNNGKIYLGKDYGVDSLRLIGGISGGKLVTGAVAGADVVSTSAITLTAAGAAAFTGNATATGLTGTPTAVKSIQADYGFYVTIQAGTSQDGLLTAASTFKDGA